MPNMNDIQNGAINALMTKLENEVNQISIILDTETTKAPKGQKAGMPVQASLTRADTGETKVGYLWYGDDATTRKYLLDAMNAADDTTGELLESAKQLRKAHGLSNLKGVIEGFDKLDKAAQKAFETSYKANYGTNGSKAWTPNKMNTIINKWEKEMGILGAKIAGHNIQYDTAACENWVSLLDKGYTNRTKRLQEIIKHPEQNTVDTFAVFANLTKGSFYNNKKYPSITTKGSAGVLSQEKIAGLFGIEYLEGAHDAGSDTKALFEIINKTRNDGAEILYKTAKKIIKEAEKEHIKIFTKKGNFTARYKNFAKKKVTEISNLVKQKNAQTAEEYNSILDVVFKNDVAQINKEMQQTTRSIKSTPVSRSAAKAQAMTAGNKFAFSIYDELKQQGRGNEQSFSGARSVVANLRRNGIKEGNIENISTYGTGGIVTDAAGDRFAQGSLGGMTSELFDAVKAIGGDLRYEIDGDTVRFWIIPEGGIDSEGRINNKDEAINFEVALVNNEGRIDSGGMSIQNIMTANYSNGNIRMSTIQEKQMSNVLRALKNVEDISELQANPRKLSRAANWAIRDVTSSPVVNIEKELNGMVVGTKGAMQNSVAQGLVDWTELAATVNRMAANGPNGEAYTYTKEGEYPYATDLQGTDFMANFMLVVNSMLSGTEEMLKRYTGTNEVVQKLFEDENLISALKDLRDKGFMSRLEGIKPQATAKGYSTIGGGGTVNALSTFHNPSDRAPTQVLNMLKRKNNEIEAQNKNMFVRLEGIAQGIDYGDARYEQVTGARISGDQFKKGFENSLGKTGMDLEDAVILPKSMAEKLTGYQTQTHTLGATELPDFITEQPMEITEDLANRFEEFFKSIGDDYKLGIGDVVRGFKTVDGVTTMVVEKLREVTTGTKLLLENGNRVTARVLSDEDFATGISKLGDEYKGAQYLIEKKGLTAKTMGPAFGGRLRQIAKQAGFDKFAKEIQNNKSFEFLNRMFTFDMDNKLIIDEANYSASLKTFVDKNGKALFEGDEKAQAEQFKELWNSIDLLAKKLLGEGAYNPNLFAGGIGIADVASYENATGMGDEETLSYEGRVHYDKKARDANARKLNAYRSKIIGDHTDKNNNTYTISEKSYRDYMLQESKRVDAWSSKREKAQNTIDSINNAIDKTMGRSGTRRQHEIEILSRGSNYRYDEATGKRYITNSAGEEIALEDWQVFIDEILTNFEYADFTKANEKDNKELWSRTIEGIIPTVAERMGWNLDDVDVVIKDANISYGAGEKFSVNRNGDFINAQPNIGKVYLPDFGSPAKNVGKLIPSGLGNTVRGFLSSLKGESAKGNKESFENMMSELNKAANDKHSSYVRNAQFSNVGASAFTNVVGGGSITDDGSITISEEYLRSFLKSADTDNVREVQEAARQLMFAYQAQAELDDETAKGFNDILNNRSANLNDVLEVQEKIVDLIIQAVKSGDMNLTGSIARYPLISGKDMNAVNIKIDESLTGETLGISPQFAMAMKMDFDGDKSRLEILQASRRSMSVEQEREAAKIDAERVKLDNEINKQALNFKSAIKAQKGETYDPNKELDDLAKEVTGTGNSQFAALMSKYNFGYVGKLSNANTYLRNALSDAGWDTSQLNSVSAGYADIINAIFQTLEQDAISAKKVFERLSLDKDKGGEQYAIDELNRLYTAYRNGNINEVLNIAQEIGLFKEWADNDQFLSATARIKVTNPEFINSHADMFDAQTGQINISLMHKAADAVEHMFGGIIKTGEDAGMLADQKGWKKLIYGNTGAGSGKYKPTTAIDSLEDRINQDYKALFNVSKTNENHDRTATDEFGNVVVAFGDNSASNISRRINGPQDAFSNAITGGFSGESVASLGGTYAHKLMELMVKSGGALHTVTDILTKHGIGGEKEDHELILARDKLSDSARASFERGAQTMMNYLISENVLGNSEITMSEESFAGQYGEDSEGAIAGASDLITFSRNENGVLEAIVHDYKFSNDGSEPTLAERILQGSEYAMMSYEQLKAELEMSKEERSKIVGNLVDKYFKGDEELAKEGLVALSKADVQIHRYMSNSRAVETATRKALGIETTKSIQRKLYNGDTLQEDVVDTIGSGVTRTYTSGADLDIFNHYQNLLEEQRNIRVKLAKAAGDMAIAEAKGEKDGEAYDLKARAVKNLSDELDNLNKTIEKLKESKDIHLLSSGQLHDLEEYEEKTGEIVKQESDAKMATASDAYRTRQEAQYGNLVTARLQKERQLAKYQIDAARAEHLLQKAPKKQQEDYRAYGQAAQNNIVRTQNELADIEEKMLAIEKEGNANLTQKERLAQGLAKIEGDRVQKIQQQNAYYNNQRGILQMMFGTLQQSVNRFFDYSAAYMIINEIKQVVRQVVQYTAQLDAKMVDLQIATGSLRGEVKGMLKDYNALAKEVGRTTATVADAANDWLRAGYEGKEATDLVRASMYLSTLGMMDAAEATSDLISVLKGWKLESEDIIGVVDKLVKVDMSAAVSAGDIAEAMQMVNYSAQQAGLEMDTLIGILTTNQEVTQRSAQVVGNSWKTVLARIQNVKAGKYTASYEDMQADDYAEEDWAALNDVETVLSTVGIELRTTATQWRSTEELLNEVAAKWENFDEVTQSAIANAFAGTRQRENFIATISNWDSVQQYAELSANAYGTAAIKMEAFTTSVEAAKNRITAAIEAWALYFDGADWMKGIYNLIADIVNNLPLIATLGAVVLVLGNFNNVTSNVISTLSSLSAKLINFGHATDNFLANFGQARDDFRANWEGGKSIINSAQADYLVKSFTSSTLKAANTGKGWGNGDAGKTTSLINSFKNAQMAAFSLSGSAQDSLQKSIGRIIGENAFSDLDINNLNGLDNNLWNVIGQLDNFDDETQNLINTLKEGGVTAENSEAAYNLLVKANQEYSGQLETLAGQLNNTKKRMSGIGEGIFALAGSAFGGLAGSYVGGNLLGDSGKIIGTVLGPIIGNAAFSGIVENKDKIANVFSSLLKGSGPIGESFKALGWGAGLQFAAAAAVGIFAAFAIADMMRKKALEEASEAFKEAENNYSNKKTMGARAAEYDELARGVDSFGRNISLSEDDYQKFLDISNNLADAFPELITYTDEAGNRFVGLAGNIGGVTERIEELIKKAQEVTDEKLLNPVLFDEAKKNAKETKDEYEKTLSAYRGLLRGNFNAYKGASNYGDYGQAMQTITSLRSMGYNVGIERQGSDYQVTIDPQDKEAIENILGAKIKELENSINQVNGEYLDQYNSIIRRDTMMNARVGDMDTETYNLLQKVLGSGAVDVNSETLHNDLGQIINQVATIANNPTVSNALTANESNYTVPYEYQELINEGLESVRQLYNNASEVDKGALANAITATGKYYFDTNGNIQANATRYSQAYDSVSNTLAFGHGLSAANQTSLTGLMQMLDADQLNAFVELVNEGIVSRTGTGLNRTNDEIMSLIMNEGPYAKTMQGYSAFYLNRRETYENMTDSETGVRATNFMSDTYEEELDKIRGLSNKEVGEIFGAFNTDAVKAFKLARTDLEKQIGEGLEDTESGVKNFWELFYQEAEKSVNNSYEVLTKFALSDVFSNVDLGEDGLISSFEELKDIMDSVANSFATLDAAQEEYNSTGTLSVETVLDMLAADESYLSVLEVENGNIQLVDNATEVLADKKLSVAKAGLVQMYQARLTEAAELQQAITSGQLADANDTEIETSKALVSANTALASSALMDAKAAYASAIAHQMAGIAKAADAAGADPTASLAGLADQLKEAQAAAHVVESVGAGLADSIQSAPKRDTNNIELAKKRLVEITGISTEDMFSIDSETGNYVLNPEYDLSKYDAAADIVDGHYVGPWTNGELAVTGAMINSDMFDNADAYGRRYNKPDTKGGGGSGNKPKEKSMEELMEAAEGIIDKEWEAMKALDRINAGEERAYTKYFILKREALENKLKGYEDSIANYQKQYIKGEISLSELEYHKFEYQKKEIETRKAIRNLDDEEVQDSINILGNLKASKETTVEAYRQLLLTADTEEERIEYTKKLNDALEDQANTVKTIYEFQKSIFEFQLKYQSLTPNSEAYNLYMQYSLDNLIKRAEQAKTEAEKTLARVKEEAIEARRQMIDSNGNRLYSEEQIQSWAQSGEAAAVALEDSTYREWITEYMNLYTQIGELFMEDFNNKINDIQRQIDKLNEERPQEWAGVWERGRLVDSAFDRINRYYQDYDKLQNQIISEVQVVLEHVSQLTDEQIAEAIDKWNAAIKQIHENAIARLTDIKDYQDATYTALVNEVNRYIKQLQKEKEIIEDTYDTELEKLKDKEDAIERTNKLLELQNNLQNAQQEKQRVYREGIGWVYESNRQKIREAEKDIDDFYRQDVIDDLNKAKDAELAILDNRIKHWEDYLEMLAEKYNEYTVLEEQRLLKELLGVKSEEEVYELIKNDMLDFTNYVDTHTSDFLENERKAHLAFNTIFNDFMGEYRSNLEQLAELKRQHLELLDLSDYIGQNDLGLEGITNIGLGIVEEAPQTSNIQGKLTTVIRNGKEIQAQIIGGNKGRTYDLEGNLFEFQDGDIVKTGGGDYQWNGKTNTATKIDNSSNSNKGKDKDKGDRGGNGGNSNSPSETKAEDKSTEWYSKTYGVDMNIAKIMKDRGYASGIENGPITYTGLAMLHGSSANPEYVLNSDQAYSLLRYMATTKPDFVTNNNEAGTQYVLNGDIVLNEVEDAAQFWNEVTMAMDRRISVTKNNR